jgi:hypothetical protein
MDAGVFCGFGCHEWAGLIIGSFFMLQIVAELEFVKAVSRPGGP